MKLNHLILAGLAVACAAEPALAHHCVSEDAPLTVTGTITSVKWINPHTLIYVSGVEAGGEKRNWVFQAGTPNTLLRTGVKSVLKEGVVITVKGFHSANKACALVPGGCIDDVRNIIMPNGDDLRVSVPGSFCPPNLPAPPH